MYHRKIKPETVRHARLFELIRQDNVVEEARFAAPEKKTLDLAEMQEFLKRANQSLTPEDDGAV